MTAKLFPPAPAKEIVLTLAGYLASRLGIPAPVAALAVRIARTHGKLFATRSKASVAAAAVVASAVLARGMRSDYPMSVVAEAAGVATSAVSRSIGTVCASLQRPLTTAVAWSGPILASLFDVSTTLTAPSPAPRLREPLPTLAPSKGASAAASYCSGDVTGAEEPAIEPAWQPSAEVAIKIPPDFVECGPLKTCISACGTAGHYCPGRRGSEVWCMNLVDSLAVFAKVLLARYHLGHPGRASWEPPDASLFGWAGLGPPPPLTG